MGLIISVAKIEVTKHTTARTEIPRICKRVVESENHTVYVPLAGKLMDVITYFNENAITYQLLDDAQYV